MLYTEKFCTLVLYTNAACKRVLGKQTFRCFPLTTTFLRTRLFLNLSNDRFAKLKNHEEILIFEVALSKGILRKKINDRFLATKRATFRSVKILCPRKWPLEMISASADWHFYDRVKTRSIERATVVGGTAVKGSFFYFLFFIPHPCFCFFCQPIILAGFILTFVESDRVTLHRLLLLPLLRQLLQDILTVLQGTNESLNLEGYNEVLVCRFLPDKSPVFCRG